MAALNRICYSLACLGISALLLASCLPGEDDLARESEFNQRTQINNTAYSLYQTANNMAAYLTGQSRRVKAPLSETYITNKASAENNIEPSPPEGVKVVKCESGMLGAMVYFTQNPKGIPPLAISGSAMARKLAERHDERYVGWYENGRITLPKLAEENGCTDTNGIVEGSPIFLAGFAYGSDDGNPIILPDPNKATWPKVGKAVTLPCPSGFSGSITRKQDCKLITDEDGAEAEDITFRTGVVEMGSVQDPGYELKAVRKKKRWECDPSQNKNVPPTTDEIMKFCRNDANNMEKPDDNVITLTAESFKQILEGSGPGYYTYACRRNADGTNKCDTIPYTPTLPQTTLRCDRNAIPERYVINPKLPIEVDDAGNVVSDTPGATKTGTIVGDAECGNGWRGDLIAGYEVRACQLVKTVDGVETPIKQAQTIYKIGYVGARCKAPPKEAAYDCPRPYSGDVILREENSMTKPLALQLQPAARGEWSKSIIPWSLFGGLLGNTNAETSARAGKEGYRIARRNLQGVANPRFTSWLESTMMPDLSKEVTGCKLTEQTCELPPDRIELGIIFDRSGSMLKFGDQPTNLTSATNRMACRARIEDIFTDKEAACALLEENAMSDGAGSPKNDVPYQLILSRYLIDRQNPTYIRMMNDAIEGRQLCGYTVDDVVGYCMPGGKERQSSCSPGTCIIPRTSVTGTYLTVAEEQLQVALNFTPPGSTVGYTEFVQETGVEPRQTFQLCDYVKDPDCDFVGDMNKLRNGVKKNNGTANAGTPLMEATAQALTQFGPPGPAAGVLLYFTDGKETDGNVTFQSNYPHPYGSLCENSTPPSDMNSSDDNAFCRGLNITESNYKEWNDDAVLLVLQSRYQSEGCTDMSTTPICANITKFYDPTTKTLVQSGVGEQFAWSYTCSRVGVTARPSVADYIKQNYPNLKVFILNLGGRELANCPSDPNGSVQMIPVDNPRGYELAFKEAFKALNTKSANPADVCNRIRSIYTNAADY